ncbi:MAG: RNA 2',3'-cyclic phosphodiesterase [Chloroflexota bacterium]|nr:MAG: RNA 2',3'-cyclic phosphodiesterase [Chloroflexota bacterium]
MMQERVRCFVALELPESLQSKLEEVQRALGSGSRDPVKWVAPFQIHITLKFLGNVDASKLTTIEDLLAEVGREARPFDLSVAHLGAFPNPRRPRVVWVGIEEGGEDLLRLQGGVEEALFTLGFSREQRPFSPHLTLGRVRENASPSQIQELSQRLSATAVPALGTTRVTSITFMRSQLTPSGPIYSHIAVVPLGAE